VVLMLVSAVTLWGAGAIVWVGQQYRTPFGREMTSGAAGSMLRPELVPLALAALAAIAAILATGRWLRRLIGLLVILAGGVLAWRSTQWYVGGWFAYTTGDIPPGSTPIGDMSTNPAGPLLMSMGALAMAAAGAVVVFRAHRMPVMGAKYSAPGVARKKSQDPDRRLWDALDEGADPTDG
jgi:uncharacterized membrane protein (TIGR02234 family)